MKGMKDTDQLQQKVQALELALLDNNQLLLEKEQHIKTTHDQLAEKDQRIIELEELLRLFNQRT